LEIAGLVVFANQQHHNTEGVIVIIIIINSIKDVVSGIALLLITASSLLAKSVATGIIPKNGIRR